MSTTACSKLSTSGKGGMWSQSPMATPTESTRRTPTLLLSSLLRKVPLPLPLPKKLFYQLRHKREYSITVGRIMRQAPQTRLASHLSWRKLFLEIVRSQRTTSPPPPLRNLQGGLVQPTSWRRPHSSPERRRRRPRGPPRCPPSAPAPSSARGRAIPSRRQLTASRKVISQCDVEAVQNRTLAMESSFHVL
uniref:Rab-GAP TBC domain-containing protein n=1 Tax=Mesocestoides corti TaxID=53468 RepID=A0A5K3FAB0_MESCO